MMPDELEYKTRNLKRIHPGFGLVVFITLVSGLLIYKIQSWDSQGLKSEPQSTQTVSHNPNALPETENARHHSEESLPDREIPDTSLSQATPQTEIVMTQTANLQPLLPDVGTLKKGELESTSWQNPFYRLLWKNKGWQFTDEGMVSTPQQISAATFVRPYQKISVSFAVEVEQNLPAFELQLLTRDPEHLEKVLVTSSVHFQQDSVSVSAELNEATKELKRTKLHLEKSPKSKRIRIRFVGTGNRFVISVGRRRVLTCTQPAQQSGKECYLSFLAEADPVKITELRIEGE